MAYLSEEELPGLGLAACGHNVRISRLCAIHGAGRIHIGSNVRIDDFTVITAQQEVRIGSYVHIGAQVLVSGQYGVDLGDFSGLSPRVVMLSGSDDLDGRFLTGPTVPPKFCRVVSGRIAVGRHAVVGAASVVLPGVTIGEGAVVGALSLVKSDLPAWGLYAGIPAKFIRRRATDLLTFAGRLDSLNTPKAGK
jgi:dTDP-4-amino-4,6-dideoxy-D-glucose acyltransferase